MSKRRMPQIMPQRNGFHQFLIEPERLGYGPCILRDLQRMRQPGPVVVPLRRQKHLRLIFQPAE